MKKECLKFIILVTFIIRANDCSISSLVPCGENRAGKNQRRLPMGDKGGKKDKDKDSKQKSVKHAKDLKVKKDKQPKSPLK